MWSIPLTSPYTTLGVWRHRLRCFLLLGLLMVSQSVGADTIVLKHKAAAGGTVTHVTNALATPGTGTSLTVNITVSGTNPVLVVLTTLKYNINEDFTTVTWSQGSESLTQIGEVTAGGGARTSIWCRAAPTAGAGTVTVNADASVPLQVNAAVFSGAHQTTPCPVGDIQTSTTAVTSVTLTPTNLGTGDASVGLCGSTSGDPTSASPTQLQLNATTPINIISGRATDTTGVTFNGNVDWGGAGAHSCIVARLVHS